MNPHLSESASNGKCGKGWLLYRLLLYSLAATAILRLRLRLPLAVVSQEPMGVCWSRSDSHTIGPGLRASRSNGTSNP
jgi:hypothetical protein